MRLAVCHTPSPRNALISVYISSLVFPLRRQQPALRSVPSVLGLLGAHLLYARGSAHARGSALFFFESVRAPACSSCVTTSRAAQRTNAVKREYTAGQLRCQFRSADRRYIMRSIAFCAMLKANVSTIRLARSHAKVRLSRSAIVKAACEHTQQDELDASFAK